MPNRWKIKGDGPIRIARDEHGVPHVEASSEADLYRGLGHCHAVDRALQMLLARIIVQGRGSEILDPSDEMLRTDLFFRRMNFGGDAEAELAKIPQEHLRLVEAYCDGVNLALAKRVPWELRLVGYRPEPWTVTDLVSLSRLVGYVSLAESQGAMERLLVEMVQAGVPRGHLEELFQSPLPGLDPELLKKVRIGERLVPESVRWSSVLPHAAASNNWVLAPRKTAGGQALLANDPHLEVNRLPAVWYEIVLRLGERFCIAATMPGLPALILGRTNDLAWGATYAFMDATDSWIEDCSDRCYRRLVDGEEKWVPFRKRTEVIRRKKKPDVTAIFYDNEHGVLDGDSSLPGLYLATRWSCAEQTGAASMSAFLRMLHAADVTAGMELLGRIETAWCFVLADRNGNIGFQMTGRMPVRRPDWDGLAPMPGWDPANDWRGFVPATDLPRVYNPETGFVATANNDLNHLGRARPINLPMGPYRAERIAEMLEGRDDWSVADTERLQMDVFSPHAVRFMDVLRPLLPNTAEGNMLREWDCCYGTDSKGAYLFEKFHRELVTEVFGNACGREALRLIAEETGILTDFYYNFERILLDDKSVWYAGERREEVFARVAAHSLKGPVRTWGSRRRLMMKHLMLGGRLPSWLGFDYGPIALRGNRATIHQGQIYRSGGRDTTFAPSFRLVIDMGETVARTCLAGGPTDRRFSRWYTSGVKDWLAGRFKTLRPNSGGSTAREAGGDERKEGA